ncbi:unnamed protein product [Soboliphyme baturini]|uniref:BPI2 domain-containing protein n=1 Tax=Soboliphyme baturini TaxID=241478 RepID=A0A183IA16_9BILA|nr:unnamed protein product [Soboliphyme baturini]
MESYRPTAMAMSALFVVALLTLESLSVRRVNGMHSNNEVQEITPAGTTLRISSDGFNAMAKPLETVFTNLIMKLLLSGLAPAFTSSKQGVSVKELNINSYEHIKPMTVTLMDDPSYNVIISETNAKVEIYAVVSSRLKNSNCDIPVVISIDGLTMATYIQVAKGSRSSQLLNLSVGRCQSKSNVISVATLDEPEISQRSKQIVVGMIEDFIKNTLCKALVEDVQVALQDLSANLPASIRLSDETIPMFTVESPVVEKRKEGMFLKVELGFSIPVCSHHYSSMLTHPLNSKVVSVAVSECTVNAFLQYLFFQGLLTTELDEGSYRKSDESLLSPEELNACLNNRSQMNDVPNYDQSKLAYALTKSPTVTVETGEVGLNAESVISYQPKSRSCLAKHLSSDIIVNFVKNHETLQATVDPVFVNFSGRSFRQKNSNLIGNVIKAVILKAINKFLAFNAPAEELSFFRIKDYGMKLLSEWFVLYGDIELLPEKLLKIVESKNEINGQSFDR